MTRSVGRQTESRAKEKEKAPSRQGAIVSRRRDGDMATWGPDSMNATCAAVGLGRAVDVSSKEMGPISSIQFPPVLCSIACLGNISEDLK